MRVKKAKSTAQNMVEEEDGKGLQKVETKRQKRAVQKGKKYSMEPPASSLFSKLFAALFLT